MVAVTEQLYAVSLVRPVTLIGLAVPVPVRVAPPPMQDTVKEVIGEPPLAAGAVKAIDALPLPTVPAPMTGAPGTPRGAALTLPEAVPAPNELVATTEQLYAVPLVSPVTVIGLIVPLLLRLVPPLVQVAT